MSDQPNLQSPNLPRPTPVPLEYRPPRDDPPPVRIVTHAIVGSILTAMVLVAGVVGTILLCVATNSGVASIPVCLLALALYIWLSITLYRNPRRRGWAIGLWIGLGVAALIEGACFVSLTRL